MKDFINNINVQTKSSLIMKNRGTALLQRSILLLLPFLMTTSCQKDFFKLERPPQNPWNTITEFERAPIGTYANLFSGDKWDITWVNTWVVKNSTGDDVDWVNDASYGYWRKSKEFNTYTDKNILNLYRTVGASNLALDFVDQNKGNPYPGISISDSISNLNRIVGELHFCRGYAYYLLETTFGHAYVPGGPNDSKDIPMPVHYATSATEAKNPVIGSTQQVWNLILSDFKIAKQLLPEKFISGVMHPSYEVRANKFAAAGMLMRTYFQMGQYDSALIQCNFIIDQNNGAYDLTEDPIEAFNKSTLARGNEVIFYAPYYDVTLVPGPNHLSVANQTYQNNTLCIWAEDRLAKSVVARLGWMNDPVNDTSFNSAALRDKRFQQLMAVRYPIDRHRPGASVDPRSVINTTTTIFTYKYFRGAGLWNTNVPLIRLAEIYLTRSILRFNQGDKTGAADDLNVVRQRAWDVSVGGPFVPVDASMITADIIGDERIIEMFAEGDRIDYLRSLKLDIPPGERAAERGYTTVPYTSEDFVWAIPEREQIYDQSLH
jgi:hypothetical protein